MRMTTVLERPAETDTDGPLAPPPLVQETNLGGNRYHIGRSWGPAGPMEQDCPCHKAECGLVDDVDEFCTQHSAIFAQTIRSRHHERDCRGAAHWGTLE